MRFEIQYDSRVIEEDIPRLPKNIRARIKQAIEIKLGNHPEVFGKPLRKSLRGYRRLRVGDYRIIFRIEGDFVKIFVIQHRSVVYENTIA